MASAMRKMAVYLGLVEDDRRYAENYEAYDEYDDYDEPADAVEPAAPAAPAGRLRGVPDRSPNRHGSAAAGRARQDHYTASTHVQ
jgi:cell division inhibitor SepF